MRKKIMAFPPINLGVAEETWALCKILGQGHGNASARIGK
jgi:hypothetical protein